MNESLRAELIHIDDHDQAVRAELAADGSLYKGYHPRMAAVHDANADRLRAIIREHVYEGLPQRYGTQWRDGPAGLGPYPVDDADDVEARRAALGLPWLAR